MTSDRVAQITERCDKATEGPWEHRGEGHFSLFIETEYAEDPDGDELPQTVAIACYSIQDADFIAHAREDIPYLLGEVARLKEQVKKLEGYEVLHKLRAGDVDVV